MKDTELYVEVCHHNGAPMALPGLDLDPVLDDDVILPGSTAEWGYRIPATGESGEVFCFRYGGELEVYPHDGRDTPIGIIMRSFDFRADTVITAIHMAYQHRAARFDDDQAA